MKHILDCTKEEAKTFLIEKRYKDHDIRISIKDDNADYPFKLYVYFQLFSGLEINLGSIVQELAEDDAGFNFWVKERLSYLANYMISIT